MAKEIAAFALPGRLQLSGRGGTIKVLEQEPANREFSVMYGVKFAECDPGGRSGAETPLV
jgi:hypothetical protein